MGNFTQITQKHQKMLCIGQRKPHILKSFKNQQVFLS